MIVGEKAIGLDHFAGFAGKIELGGCQHLVHREAQFLERRFHALKFRRRIVGDHAFDFDARLVEIGGADGQAFGQRVAAEHRGPVRAY